MKSRAVWELLATHLNHSKFKRGYYRSHTTLYGRPARLEFFYIFIITRSFYSILKNYEKLHSLRAFSYTS